MDPRKRWIALAGPVPGGWAVEVVPVGELATLLRRLLVRADGGAVALGLDCPIGLPRAYAALLGGGAADFPAFLGGLTAASDFFKVCDDLDEVAPGRPFYPRHGQAGMTRAAFAARLGLEAAGLSRACDRATADRPAGAPLFWTLGANQVGKAAVTAWRDLLLPALAGPAPPALWPFDGALGELLAPGRVAIAECYPAEAMRQLGLRMNGSKRRHADRIALAPALRDRLAALDAQPDPALDAMLSAGLGADAAGEDRLDCLLGLLGLLQVLMGRRTDAVPDDPWVRRWEGWVLGQAG
jgi:hypothetical protein